MPDTDPAQQQPSPELLTSLAVTDADRLVEAEGAVRGRCGWHIAPEREETVVVDGSGEVALMLPTMRLVEVLAVSEHGRALDADDYDWSEAGVLRRRSGRWSDRLRAVTVTMRHGYPDAPPEIAGVVRSLAQRAPRAGVKSQTRGPFSETYDADDFTSYDDAILDRYRVPGAP